MVISDKQSLRRCVKQAVRRAAVTETMLRFDVLHGDIGVENIERFLMRGASGTPFGADSAAAYAALDALGLPAQDPDRAKSIQRSYERSAYLREILDVMRAQRVLTLVSMNKAHEAVFEDDRLSPLLSVDCDCFEAGRYGVDYAAAAQRIVGAMQACGARDVLASELDPAAMEYAMLPLSEDTGAVLHTHVQNERALAWLLERLNAFPLARVVLSGERELEADMIKGAAQHDNLLIRLSDIRHMDSALSRLGTRFIPYASAASTPEMMLGSWINAREQIWQALFEAYLPLARSGYVLNSNDVESDVAMLLGGNLHAFYLR